MLCPCTKHVIVTFFFQVNGLTNIFWGWGREDDELYVRMKEAGMTVCDLDYKVCPFQFH